MLISKCDKCKKIIDEGNKVVAGYELLRCFEFCKKCGKSITSFLEKVDLEKSSQKVNKGI